MAGNRLPDARADLLVLGTNMAGGLEELGPALGIVQLTAAQLRATLAAYEEAETAFGAARTERQEFSNVLQAADAELTAWLLKARAVLTTHLGTRWSPAWVEAGWTGHSTAVPRRVAERSALVKQLAAYFAAKPGQEVPSAGVTATAAHALREAYLAARAALNAVLADLEQKGAARKVQDEALRTQMRLLIHTLAALLPRGDGRWTAFGLNIPAAATTPDAPQSLTAIALPGGTVLAQCEAAPLATSYRWRVKVAGEDTEYRLAATTAGPLAELRIAPGQRVELIVQAVNGSRQSAPSEPVGM